ncbi:MAG: tRNA threonylcarbamoyladenosine dehydratase [Leptospirales bacterium]|nr:tRNA threonylcarbamoyladenosine dehydratase [Leptospirales bacterium]
MVNPAFHRLSLLTGDEAAESLFKTRVIVFGLGGVGSWCAEALARSGIGRICIVDSDVVCVTNINRQIQATKTNVGESKAEALKKRLLEINPDCEVTAFGSVFSKDSAGIFEIDKADFVIDAIDSLTHKLDLIDITTRYNVKIFSSMGMAQKLDPSLIRAGDIWETRSCPLARLVRGGLRKRGFTGNLTVVYSEERIPQRTDEENVCGSAECMCPDGGHDWCTPQKARNGSIVTVTATAGMLLASLVIRSVINKSSPSSVLA